MKKFLKIAVCSMTAGFLFFGSPTDNNFLLKVSATYQSEIIATPNVAVVSTREGKLQGYIHKGIYNYKGVQYAKAERFMPSQKIDSWSG